MKCLFTLIFTLASLTSFAGEPPLGLLFTVQFNNQKFDFRVTEKEDFLAACKREFEIAYPKGTNNFHFVLKTTFLLTTQTTQNSIQANAQLNYSYPCNSIFEQAVKMESDAIH